MKRRHWLGLLISVACLWWAARGVSWSEVWLALREARRAVLGATAVGAVLVGVLLRALRWRVFLPPDDSPPRRELVTATGVGLMANNLLPARVGEFVRAYVLGRRSAVPVTTAIGSLFVERLFDGSALVLILLAASILIDVPEWMDVLALVGGGVFLVLLVLEVLVVSVPEPLFRLLHRTTARFLPERWEASLEGALRTFVDGFRLLQDPRRIAVAVLLTFALWLANGALYYLGLLAFDLGRVGFGGALVVQSVASLGVAIPSSPGFVGTFQAFVVKALSALGVDRNLAFSYSVGFHIAQYVPVTVYGLYLLWRADLSWGEIEKSEERVEDRLEEAALLEQHRNA